MDVAGLILISCGIIIVGFITLLGPIEYLLLLSIAFGFAGSSIIPATESSIYYYVRFMPTIMMVVRLIPLMDQDIRRKRVFPNILLKPLIIFFLFALSSTVYSTSPNTTLQRSISLGIAIIAFGIVWPAYRQNIKQIERGVYLATMLISIVVAIGLAQGFLSSGNYGLPQTNFDRFTGIFGNANTLGSVAMLACFPLLGFWYQANIKKRLLLTAFLGTNLVAILFSGSRASLAGIVSGGLALIMIGLRTTLIIKIITVFAIIVIGISLWSVLPDSVLKREGDSGRSEIWDQYIAYGLKTPFWGSGFGANDAAYLDFLMTRQVDTSLLAFSQTNSQTHNAYLRIFVGLGTVGLFLATVIFSSLLFEAAQVIPQMSDQVIPLTLLVCVIAGLTNSIFEEWLFSFGNSPTNPFWIFAFALAIYIQDFRNSSSVTQNTNVS